MNYTKLPNFFSRNTGRAETVDLEWDGSKYTASLTDTNGVLSNYTFSSDTRGIDVSVIGNKLVITSDIPDGKVTITATNGSQSQDLFWDTAAVCPVPVHFLMDEFAIIAVIQMIK